MSLRRLMTTRLAGSGRVTTDMSEAARILFCWHFCWHSRVEDFQIIAAHAVQIGGEGRNRSLPRPNSSQKYQCLCASQAIAVSRHSLGFRCHYTQLRLRLLSSIICPNSQSGAKRRLGSNGRAMAFLDFWAWESLCTSFSTCCAMRRQAPTLKTKCLSSLKSSREFVSSKTFP